MLASIAVFAQAMLLAAPSTNVTLVSETKIENAWQRKVVMKDGAGKIINDDEQVGEAADAAADREVAEQAGAISDAAKTAMLGQIQRLESASANAAKSAIAVALVMPPELTRENLTGFVVKETSDGSVDTQWVWYNRSLSLKPNRYVVYEGIQLRDVEVRVGVVGRRRRDRRRERARVERVPQMHRPPPGVRRPRPLPHEPERVALGRASRDGVRRHDAHDGRQGPRHGDHHESVRRHRARPLRQRFLQGLHQGVMT